MVLNIDKPLCTTTVLLHPPFIFHFLIRERKYLCLWLFFSSQLFFVNHEILLLLQPRVCNLVLMVKTLLFAKIISKHQGLFAQSISDPSVILELRFHRVFRVPTADQECIQRHGCVLLVRGLCACGRIGLDQLLFVKHRERKKIIEIAPQISPRERERERTPPAVGSNQLLSLFFFLPSFLVVINFVVTICFMRTRLCFDYLSLFRNI